MMVGEIRVGLTVNRNYSSPDSFEEFRANLSGRAVTAVDNNCQRSGKKSLAT